MSASTSSRSRSSLVKTTPTPRSPARSPPPPPPLPDPRHHASPESRVKSIANALGQTTVSPARTRTTPRQQPPPTRAAPARPDSASASPNPSFASPTVSFRAKNFMEVSPTPTPASSTFSSSVQSGTASSRAKAAPPPPSKCFRCGKIRVGKCMDCSPKPSSSNLRPSAVAAARNRDSFVSTPPRANTAPAARTNIATKAEASVNHAHSPSTSTVTTTTSDVAAPATIGTNGTHETNNLAEKTTPEKLATNAQTLPAHHKYWTLRDPNASMPKLSMPPKKRSSTLPVPPSSTAPPEEPALIEDYNPFVDTEHRLSEPGQAVVVLPKADNGVLVRVVWPAVFGQFEMVRVYSSTSAWEVNEQLMKLLHDTPDIKIPPELEYIGPLFMELQMPNGEFLKPTDCVLEVLKPGSIAILVQSRADITKEETWQSGERLELALALRTNEKKDFWKAPWTTDTGNCQRCSARFSLVTRRHHCRRCGNIICEPCSPALGRVAGYEGPVRICKSCLEVSLY